jgi:uncharacterized damage-inducible protein DinB
MSPEVVKAVADISLKNIQQEHATTKKVFAAVPQEHVTWRPHERAKTAIELAWHIATADVFFLNGVCAGKFEMAGGPPPAPKTMAEVIGFYEKALPEAVGKAQALSPEALAKNINFMDVFNAPAFAYLDLSLRHSVHHRGQLSTYIRGMGAKVPSIYGPSADEDVVPQRKAGA